MTKKYTLSELLIIAVAREINDFDNVILGVGLPTTSGALAKALHAPQANLMMEAGMIDFEPLVPPNHIADVMAVKGYACATDLFTAFTTTYRGFVDICFLGVGQVDKFGNLNKNYKILPESKSNVIQREIKYKIVTHINNNCNTFYFNQNNFLKSLYHLITVSFPEPHW